MISQQYLMFGVECAQCGQPAHHVEVYPNGTRTVHKDPRNRPCDTLHAANEQPGERGPSRPTTTAVPALARSQQPGVVDALRPSTAPGPKRARCLARVAATREAAR